MCTGTLLRAVVSKSVRTFMVASFTCLATLQKVKSSVSQCLREVAAGVERSAVVSITREKKV